MGCVIPISSEAMPGLSRAPAVGRALGEAVTSARAGQAAAIISAANLGRGFRVVGDGGAGKTCLLRHVRDKLKARGESVVIYVNFAEVCGEADLVWLCLRQLLARRDATSGVTRRTERASEIAYERMASALRDALDAGLLAMASGGRPFGRTDDRGVMRSLIECLARCTTANDSMLILIDHVESSLLPSSGAAGVSHLLASLFVRTQSHEAISVGFAHRPGLEHVIDHESVAIMCESRDTVILPPLTLPVWDHISTCIDPPPEVDLADLVALTQGDVATTIGVLAHLAARDNGMSPADSYDTGAGAHPWASAGALASLAAGRNATRDAFTYLASLHAPSINVYIDRARELDANGPNIMHAVACNKASCQLQALEALHADERALRSLQFAGLIREDRDRWWVCNPLTARVLRDLEASACSDR